MDLELSDKVAIVTGGSKGIGEAITRTLLAEGARVANINRSTEEGLLLQEEYGADRCLFQGLCDGAGRDVRLCGR